MKKNRYFQLRLSDDEKKKLSILASSKDITCSEFLRQAIVKQFKRIGLDRMAELRKDYKS